LASIRKRWSEALREVFAQPPEPGWLRSPRGWAPEQRAAD